MTLIAGLVVVGTLGMHFIEGMSYVDAFYFISMIVTAEGPSYSPSTHMGKIFAAMMAFVSVGTVVVSLGFLFGPFLGGLWRIGYMKLEHELEHLRHNNPDQEKPKE